MARITVDLDSAMVQELQRRRTLTGSSLDSVVSELLAAAIRQSATKTPRDAWTSRSMVALVDLGDKEALRRAIDAG